MRQDTTTDADGSDPGSRSRESAAPRRGRVQRALEALYGRVGSRIVLVGIAGAFIVAAFAVTVTGAAAFRYLGISPSRLLSFVVLWIPIFIAMALAGLFGSAGQLRTLLAWPGDPCNPGDAAETWYALVGIRRVATRGIVGAGLGVPPAATYITVDFHQPWWSAFSFALGGFMVLAALWVVVVSGIEVATRPMLEDVAARLPTEFDPAAQGMRLATRALAPLPIVTLGAVLLAGAYTNLVAIGALRATLAIGVALVAVAIMTVIFLVINRSVLSPIDDLIAATERVRAGDKATHVPLLSGDELGTLAHSFNGMLADLRRKTEELEASRQDLQRHADELRTSRERIVAAADAERRRLERDLHDGAQQHLVLLGLKLGLTRRQVEEDPAAAAATLDELHQNLDRALRELRDLAHGIYPAVLENEGLPGALLEAVQRSAIPTELECDSAGRFPPELEAAAYFCCLEALQNAAKHAGENARAHVKLAHRDSVLAFEVSDDGQGFDSSAAGRSAGVQNMTDRIGAVGGTLQIETAPGQGTTVIGTIPLKHEEGIGGA